MSNQWLNGRLVDESDPGLLALLNAASANDCNSITTARVSAGRALHLAHHLRRLERDARAIGLGKIDRDLASSAFMELGRATFGDGAGVVRVEVRPNPSGDFANLHATTRALGDEVDRWTARTAPVVHDGPTRFPGVKPAQRQLYDDARAFAKNAGVNEALLFDASGRLVEGAVSNILIVDAEGTLSTPDLALGAVAGIGLEIIKEQVPELLTRTIDRANLLVAREIIAVNAVRGARPIVQLDDQIVGDGSAGPWAKRLNAMLFASE